MALLVNPATYLSVSAFKAEPNDYDLSGYSDANLQDILVRASGKADAIMRRTYLPTEITEQFEGDGTNELILGVKPLIFVKSVQLVMPGFAPFALPIGSLLIDYERGKFRSWSPMIFQSLGVANVFPKNGLPVVVDLAYGVGYAIPAPVFSLSTAGVNGTLPSGQYDFAVTTRTQPGESLPSATQTVTLNAQGGVNVTITPVLGAFNYRVYAAVHGGTLALVAESPATNFATPTVAVTVTSLAPPSIGSYPVPSTDTSMWPVPNEIVEATRLLALSIIWEQNNKANRGIYELQSDGRREIWKSTEGNSGRGTPLAVEEATNILQPYAFRGIR